MGGKRSEPPNPSVAPTPSTPLAKNFPEDSQGLTPNDAALLCFLDRSRRPERHLQRKQQQQQKDVSTPDGVNALSAPSPDDDISAFLKSLLKAAASPAPSEDRGEEAKDVEDPYGNLTARYNLALAIHAGSGLPSTSSVSSRDGERGTGSNDSFQDVPSLLRPILYMDDPSSEHETTESCPRVASLYRLRLSAAFLLLDACLLRPDVPQKEGCDAEEALRILTAHERKMSELDRAEKQRREEENKRQTGSTSAGNNSSGGGGGKGSKNNNNNNGGGNTNSNRTRDDATQSSVTTGMKSVGSDDDYDYEAANNAPVGAGGGGSLEEVLRKDKEEGNQNSHAVPAALDEDHDGREDADRYARSEFYFRLNLYRAKFSLAAARRSASSGSEDATAASTAKHHRTAKKELKGGLEIFQHKLRGRGHLMATTQPAKPSSASVVRGEEEGHARGDPAAAVMFHDDEGAQNASALYLKADLENQRSNHRKSMKLIAEARHASDRGLAVTAAEGDGSYRNGEHASAGAAVNAAVYYHNMACVHQSMGKVHLALHYYTRAIRECAREGVGSVYVSGGSVRPVPVQEILHNTGICALQAGQYLSAYECLSKCVSRPQFSSTVPSLAFPVRPWLRMAEACIGLHVQKIGVEDFGWSVVGGINGTARHIVIKNSSDQSSVYDKDRIPSFSHTLGSPDDLADVQKKPLHRALYCLEMAYQLCNSVSSPSSTLPNPNEAPDDDCLEATLLALAYVNLELGDPVAALAAAREMLPEGSSNDDEGGPVVPERRRRRATARLYACEALCHVGDPSGALEMLCGEERRHADEGDDEEAEPRGAPSPTGPARRRGISLEKLVEDLSAARDGEEREDSSNGNDAECMANLAAAGASAASGDMDVAERRAQAALASGVPGTRGVAVARRFVVYCMLCRGDVTGSMEVLREDRLVNPS